LNRFGFIDFQDRRDSGLSDMSQNAWLKTTGKKITQQTYCLDEQVFHGVKDTGQQQ
jgi:hypothetical protein